MKTTEVEGSMYDNSSSDSSDESTSEFEIDQELNEGTCDDADEEIEVFSSVESTGTKRAPEQPNIRPATQSTNNTSSYLDTPLSDGFGINYQPIPLSKIEEAHESCPPISTISRVDSTSNDDDDDDEFSLIATNDVTNLEAISEGIQRVVNLQDIEHPNFSEFQMIQEGSTHTVKSDSKDGFCFGDLPSIDEPLLLKPSGKNELPEVLIHKQALKDITDVYGTGMGDQEVLLLDVVGDSKLKVLDLVESSRGLTAINEEEEEEEDDCQAGAVTVDPINTEPSEWDLLESSNQVANSTAVKNDTNHLVADMNYHEALSFCKMLDLSEHETSIVIEETAKSPIFSFSSSSRLDFPGCKALLKFPFLLACVDYNPFCPEHFGMMKEIFAKLIHDYDSAKLQPIDEHWECLGFQGKDPRTDLNRSMKLLSVLQMLHFIDAHKTFVSYLFGLSQSLRKTDETVPSPAAFDSSWPFMCVSIMFTKEALQTLRSGVLNAECNKHKDILTVLHEYHHACFGEFCILLKKEPAVHHAHLLAKLRTLSASKPLKILDHFRRRKYLNHTADKVEKLETLTDLEAINESSTEDYVSKNGWTSIFRRSKAEKFAL